jgi:3-oxoacyl-[acyl-carrier protein] reductase
MGIFSGKTVIVTGSGQGVGRAIALAFGAAGGNVVTNNRRAGSTGRAQMTDAEYSGLSDAEKADFEKIYSGIKGDAQTTADQIKAAGGEATAVFADISLEADAKRLVDSAAAAYGSVDIVVNVAGAFGSGALTEMSAEEWDRVTAIKPRGYFFVIKHAAPYMQKKGWGRIINTTSKALMGDTIKMAHYCTANAGVMGLTQAAACEFFADGITVNSFAPWARTRAAYEADFTFHGDSAVEGLASFPKAEDTPDPEAIAPFVMYLCSDEASQITGTNFTLAGNLVAMHQYPIITRTMMKQGRDYWTLDELKREVPGSMLRGYSNILSFV